MFSLYDCSEKVAYPSIAKTMVVLNFMFAASVSIPADTKGEAG